MVTKYLSRLAVIAVLASGFVLAARADEGGDDGEIDGTEELHLDVVLTATTNAPAGATGSVKLESEYDHGTNDAVLLVQTAGLSNGAYTVSITDLTGTNTYVLGTFDPSTLTGDGEDDDQNEEHHGDSTNAFSNCSFTNNFDCASWTNWVGSWTNWFGSGSCTNQQGEDDGDDDTDHKVAFLLPDGVNALDIASLEIADSNSVVMLTGDFSTATTNGHYDADCAVTPGPLAPTLTGRATINVLIKKSKSRGAFLLTAQGAPANLKLNVIVNGLPKGSARSDKLGNVTIKKLREKNLATVRSVILEDQDSNQVLSVRF